MIVDAHGLESVLDGAIKFERKPYRRGRYIGNPLPRWARRTFRSRHSSRG